MNGHVSGSGDDCLRGKTSVSYQISWLVMLSRDLQRSASPCVPLSWEKFFHLKNALSKGGGKRENLEKLVRLKNGHLDLSGTSIAHGRTG